MRRAADWGTRPAVLCGLWLGAAALISGAAEPPGAEDAMTASDPSTRTSNRLLHEKSPYLLQHARNPVDWYPWGDEAFAKARREDKPIFLSIGYSTCHWCHVMERESFEDPGIAALMNASFVSIKVDREEHPDVDQVYMAAVTALTGHGGWPLTAFLTPDLKPFFGGTYFPPERRWNMPGMRDLLPAVAKAWSERRGELAASAEQITASLNARPASTAEPEPPAAGMLDQAFQQAAASFDASDGGFGEAPKFPRSHELSFLLRYWARTGTTQALDMAVDTLDHLARGGIHDQLGGGFHRYATDAQWLVPHFEKMLYDQALLAVAYLEAYRATKRSEHARTARDIFGYVLRDLADPLGGFYSAEDADSEGEEGKFYVWTPGEILAILGPADGELFNRFYGVTPEGNFEHGTSILHAAQPLETFAQRQGLDESQLSRRLADGRAALLAARGRRVRPHRDDKVLTSWNGLMIAAFASGAASLDEPQYLQAARRAADFVLLTLTRDGGLLRRWRDGEARYAGTLEDYAFFIHGLLELYQADFDPRWLAEAARLGAQMLERFSDGSSGGFFLRDAGDAPLIVRSKELYDGAVPSGNSMAAFVCLRLGRLTGERRFEEAGRRALAHFAPMMRQAPFAFPQMHSALDFALGPTQEVVIAGDPADPAARRMVRAVHERFLPRAVAILHPAGPDGRAIEALAPFVAAQGPLQGRPAAYVCRDFTCDLPVTGHEALARRLDAEP